MQCVSLRKEQSEDNMNATLNDTSYEKDAEFLSEYLQHYRNGNSSLSSFWMTYIDIVDVLFNMMRASRVTDWLLHLASI